MERIKGQSEADVRSALVQISSSLPSPLPVISGLLFGVLVEPEYSSPYLRTIGAITKESYAGCVDLLKKLTADRFPRLLDSVRSQLIWIISTLIQLNVSDTEQLFVLLLRNIISGNVSKSNLALTDDLLKLCTTSRDWLYSRNALTVASLAYSLALLIPDHHRVENEALRERETSLLILLFRERFDAIKLAGRDMIRAIYNISLIPEVKAVWEQIIMAPADQSNDSSHQRGINGSSTLNSTNLRLLLSTPTPKVVLSSRVTPELETWLTFVFTNAKNGQQVHFQKWLGAKYFASPENETLAPELVRWIVGVHHPTNAILQSNIVPRYKVVGWLIGQLRTPHIQANARLSLFYDWLFYTPQSKENIMNIEPAALLMMQTLSKEPSFVSALAESLMVSTDNYLVKEAPQMREDSRRCVQAASRLMLDKKVVPSFEPLLTSTHLPAPLRDALRKVFESAPPKKPTQPEPSSGKGAAETHHKGDPSPSPNSGTPTASPSSSQHIPVPSSTELPALVSQPSNEMAVDTPLPSASQPQPTTSSKVDPTSNPNNPKLSSGTSNPKLAGKATTEAASSSPSTPTSTSSSATVATASNVASATPASDSLSPSNSSSSLFGSPPPKVSNSPRVDDHSVFDGWKAALSSGGGKLDFASNAMDLDLHGSPMHQSSEIVLTPLQLSKYADSIAMIASKAESGAVKEARKELKSFLSTLALEPSSFDASSSEVVEMATKIHESLTNEYTAMRMRGDNGLFGFSAAAPISSFIHTQFFESLVDFLAEPKKYAKGMENVMRLFDELRKLENKFGSRLIWFLLASNLPHLIDSSDSEEKATTQDDCFAKLLASEEEMTREEKRGSKGLESARFMKPYIHFTSWLAKTHSKDSQEVFCEDMTALALWQAQTFNRVASLSLRYLPDFCIGSVPFIALIMRTSLPMNGLTLQSGLSAQTITLCGANLSAVLRASLQWDSYSQQLFWNALTSEYMFATEPLIDALIELLPNISGDVKESAESLQCSLQLISLIGPIPKLVQSVLSMDIRTHTYSTAALMRWMVEDEFQTELAKSLPSILTNLAKQDTQLEKAEKSKKHSEKAASSSSSSSSSDLPTHGPFHPQGENFCARRALMHLTLAYCVIPGDLDLLFDHAPLRKHIQNLLKTKCADTGFQSLQNALQEKEEKEQPDKPNVETKTRSSKKRAHAAPEEAADDEEGEASPKATAPPRAKRKKE